MRTNVGDIIGSIGKHVGNIVNIVGTNLKKRQAKRFQEEPGGVRRSQEEPEGSFLCIVVFSIEFPSRHAMAC